MMSHRLCTAAMLAVCITLPVHPQPKDTAADQQAYHAALALRDPAQRLRALRAFSVQYPDTKYFDALQDAALRVLLNTFPTRTTEIEDQVRVNVGNADKGLDRWQMETNEAAELATANVALPLAQKLAEDAVHNLTEDNYGRTVARTYGQLELPLPAPDVILLNFKTARAAALVALAHVHLDRGKAPLAMPLLDEAARLNPTDADLHALRGELALRLHRSAQALDEFEQAAASGTLTTSQQQALHNLYSAQHNGSIAGLDDELDARYKTLFPPPFTPAVRTSATLGHTVLLEEFTGSSCEPCAGADVAADALLSRYSRAEVVVLEWHEHNPRPDPLTNPDSVARADLFGAEATPEFVLDGRRIAVFGGTRDQSEAVYKQLTTFADAQLSRSSGVTLQLSSLESADGSVHATVGVAIAPADKLATLTEQETAPWPGEKIPLRTHLRAQPERVTLALKIALVEDDVRYSGENGIRLHRMVVRAVDPTAIVVQAGAREVYQASFDPSAISQALTRYLTDYETGNDRFGDITLSNKNVQMRPGHLALAAWLEEENSHHVLEAAFAQLAAEKVDR